MLTATDIRNLLSKGEHLTLECKRCENRLPNSLWDTYSAFANSYGGYILLGVEEHRTETDPSKRFTIQGVATPDKLITDFWNLANDPNKVNINLLTDDDVQIITLEGKDIIAIHVPRADYHMRPVYINGNPAKGAFRRNHEGDYHCSKGEISSMFRDASDEGNDGLLLRHYYMGDLDAETLRAYRQVFEVRNPGHLLNEYNDKDFLCSLGGYVIDRESGEEGLTAAGLLMFGQGQPIRERFDNIRLDYVDKTNLAGDMRYSDRLTYDFSWENNIYQFIKRVLPRLTSDLPRPFVLEGMQRNDDTPLHKLIREALTNMIIHADFMTTGVLRAEKRDDGFYFSNPGTVKLPIENVYQGGVSRARNPRMQNMLRMIGLGENLGTGFPTMVDAWKKKFRTLPKLEDNLQINFTELTFSGMHASSREETTLRLTESEKTFLKDFLKEKHAELTERQRDVVLLIADNFLITNADLGKRLRVSDRTIRTDTSVLQEAGILLRRNGRKRGQWQIVLPNGK